MALQRATPGEMRKALEAVQALKKVGILFVPMPVINAEHHSKLIVDQQLIFESLIKLAEEDL